MAAERGAAGRRCHSVGVSVHHRLLRVFLSDRTTNNRTMCVKGAVHPKHEDSASTQLHVDAKSAGVFVIYDSFLHNVLN